MFLPILILSFFILNSKSKNGNKFIIKNINKEYMLLKKSIYKDLYNKSLYKKHVKVIKDNYDKFKKNTFTNLFVLKFNDDISAKDTENIRNIISLILLIGNSNDEVLLKLNSSGGFINNYGLAAMQLKRLKGKIKLTISIDLIAASGGYLLASVADKIIASSFAIIGSIGVISVIPNFNKIITKNNIEIEHHTAGKYKSTLNIIGKNTEHGREKFVLSLNRAHYLFKKFIFENRPILDIEKISTGEYWYASDAINLKLVDEIKTSDEYILDKLDKLNIYEIILNKNTNFFQRYREKIKHFFIKLMIK